MLLVNDDAELEPGARGALLGAPARRRPARHRAGQVRFHARRDDDQHRGARRRPARRRPTTGSRARRRVDGGPVEEVFGAIGVRRPLPSRDARRDRRLRRELLRLRRGRRRRLARPHGRLELRSTCPRSVAYHHGSATAGEASRAEVLPRRPQPDAAAGQERDRAASSRAGAGRWRSTTSRTWRSSRVTDRTLAPLRGRLAGPARVADATARAGAADPQARPRSPRRPARSARGASGRRTAHDAHPLPRAARRGDGGDGHPRHGARARDRGRGRLRAPPRAGDLGDRAAAAGVVVAQPAWPLAARALRRSGARLIYDLYDPEPLEALQFLAGGGTRCGGR